VRETSRRVTPSIATDGEASEASSWTTAYVTLRARTVGETATLEFESEPIVSATIAIVGDSRRAVRLTAAGMAHTTRTVSETGALVFESEPLVGGTIAVVGDSKQAVRLTTASVTHTIRVSQRDRRPCRRDRADRPRHDRDGQRFGAVRARMGAETTSGKIGRSRVEGDGRGPDDLRSFDLPAQAIRESST